MTKNHENNRKENKNWLHTTGDTHRGPFTWSMNSREPDKQLCLNNSNKQQRIKFAKYYIVFDTLPIECNFDFTFFATNTHMTPSKLTHGTRYKTKEKNWFFFYPKIGLILMRTYRTSVVRTIVYRYFFLCVSFVFLLSQLSEWIIFVLRFAWQL